MITSWSFSKLGDFEQCKLKTKLKHIDKIPEPERPLPPGKTEHANDRGTRIHTDCELYINGTNPELAPRQRNTSALSSTSCASSTPTAWSAWRASGA